MRSFLPRVSAQIGVQHQGQICRDRLRNAYSWSRKGLSEELHCAWSVTLINRRTAKTSDKTNRAPRRPKRLHNNKNRPPRHLYKKHIKQTTRDCQQQPLTGTLSGDPGPAPLPFVIHAGRFDSPRPRPRPMVASRAEISPTGPPRPRPAPPPPATPLPSPAPPCAAAAAAPTSWDFAAASWILRIVAARSSSWRFRCWWWFGVGVGVGLLGLFGVLAGVGAVNGG